LPGADAQARRRVFFKSIMSEQDNIDLQKLSQRELLIVTHRKVAEIAEAVDKLGERQARQEVRLSLIEQRVMLFGAVFGLLGAAAVQIVISVFK